MFKVIYCIVILLMVIVRADETCKKEQDISHLVQSLQDCANAITGLQPSSEIQEKCSPDDTLLQRIENITLTLTNLSAVIEEIKGDIGRNSDDLAILSLQYAVCGSLGWTRVAYLDMSDPSEECPTELRLYNESGVRACGRQPSLGASCDSVTFSTNDISYSKVCGRIIGYQWRTPNAVESLGGDDSINSPYVDGISITHGSPRQHIWTLMGGLRDNFTTAYECPCNSGSTISVPSFIGNDYFCESANPSSSWAYIFYPDDPLWDGKECGGVEGPCCTDPDIPWFNKVLDSTTTDDIELRVCEDQDSGNEDTPISLYEIYVK